MDGNNGVYCNAIENNKSDALTSAKDLSHELAIKVIPVTGLILTIAFIGLFGNVLILIVYSKYYRMSNFRYFVLCLAYIDLLSCITTLPAEAHTQVNWFTFRYASLCKLKSFLNVFTIFSSALTFLFLACDRYNKICHPFSRQIEPPLARKLCIISVIISAVMSSPAAVFWGTQTYDVSNGNSSITVQICEKSDLFADKVYPLVYIVSAVTLPVCIAMLLTAFCNVMIVWKLVRGLPETSALGLNGQHMDMDSTAEGTCLQTVSEAGNTVDQVTPQTVCNHSLRFWRHKSFPTGKCLDRKRIYYCKNCKQFEYDWRVYTDDSFNQIDNKSDKTNSSTKVLKQLKRPRQQHCSNGHNIRTCPNSSKTSQLANQTLEFELNENAKRKGSDTTTKYTLNVKSQTCGSSKMGDIQAIYEKNADHASERRTSHLSEMDISKVDSITLHGLHRWKAWRDQALTRKALNSRRKTVIMMILSSVFILTIVIYFSLIILVADVDGVFRSMTTTKTVVFFFFWRLYFINSVINPVLYGLLDQRFRKGLAKLCCNRRLYH